MYEYTNVLLDYENSTEIVFCMPPGAELSYPNEVVDFIRSAKNRTELWVSSAGMREVKFQVQTSTSPAIERQLDYFRRTGKSLLLFIPSLFFASEIVIDDVQLTVKCETTQTFDVSAFCFGIEGKAMLANDPNCFWVTTTTADVDSICGNVITLSNTTEYIEIHGIPVDTINIIPENYTAYYRVKSSNGATDNLKIGMYDQSTGYITTDLITAPTTSYSWCAINITVPSTSLGHGINTLAHKNNNDADYIYVDLIAYVHASGLITV